MSSLGEKAAAAARVDLVPGGKGDKLQPKDVDAAELAKGKKVEREHTSSDALAQEIALDHLKEDPHYYSKLEKAMPGEVSKEAGVLDALRTAFTGRVPLYHGTSLPRASNIRAVGLQPQGAKGISTALNLSDVEKGLAFTTRNPTVAKTYATQQVGLDRAARLRNFLQRHQLPGHDFITPEIETALGRSLGALPGGGKRVVRMNVPRSLVHQHEGVAPELHLGQGAILQRQALRNVHPLLEQVPASNFMFDVPLRGGVPSQYVKGSPTYQGVSAEELRQHFRNVRKDPRGVGKDVLRSLFGVQHRPSTLLRMGDQIKTSGFEEALRRVRLSEAAKGGFGRLGSLPAHASGPIAFESLMGTPSTMQSTLRNVRTIPQELIDHLRRLPDRLEYEATHYDPLAHKQAAEAELIEESPSLLRRLGTIAAMGTAAHVGANAINKHFFSSAAGQGGRLAAGLSHALAGKKMSPWAERMMRFGLGPESTMHYQMGQQLGNVVRQAPKARQAEILAQMRAHIGSLPELKNAPLSSAIHHGLDPSVLKKQESWLSKFPTVAHDAPERLRDKAIPLAAGAASMAAAPDLAIHYGINTIRDRLGHSQLGQTLMAHGLHQGVEGTTPSKLMKTLIDYGVSPAALDTHRLGLAVNAAAARKGVDPQEIAQYVQPLVGISHNRNSPDVLKQYAKPYVRKLKRTAKKHNLPDLESLLAQFKTASVKEAMGERQMQRVYDAVRRLRPTSKVVRAPQNQEILDTLKAKGTRAKSPGAAQRDYLQDAFSPFIELDPSYMPGSEAELRAVAREIRAPSNPQDVVEAAKRRSGAIGPRRMRRGVAGPVGRDGQPLPSFEEALQAEMERRDALAKHLAGGLVDNRLRAALAPAQINLVTSGRHSPDAVQSLPRIDTVTPRTALKTRGFDPDVLAWRGVDRDALAGQLPSRRDNSGLFFSAHPEVSASYSDPGGYLSAYALSDVAARSQGPWTPHLARTPWARPGRGMGRAADVRQRYEEAARAGQRLHAGSGNPIGDSPYYERVIRRQAVPSPVARYKVLPDRRLMHVQGINPLAGDMPLPQSRGEEVPYAPDFLGLRKPEQAGGRRG